MRPEMLSSSTPYSREPDISSGSIPKKLPTPQAGSKILPEVKPMRPMAS